MKTKYTNLIVLNKEELLKDIQEAEESLETHKSSGDTEDILYCETEIRVLKEILKSSKPLTPFIKDSFDNGIDAGHYYPDRFWNKYRKEQLNKEIEW